MRTNATSSLSVSSIPLHGQAALTLYCLTVRLTRITGSPSTPRGCKLETYPLTQLRGVESSRALRSATYSWLPRVGCYQFLGFRSTSTSSSSRDPAGGTTL